MANVNFIIDADEAAAVKGFLKIVDAQRKAERGSDRMAKSSRRNSTMMQRGMNSTVGSLGRMAAGFVGVTAAIAAGRAAWGLFLKDIKDSVASLKTFQSEFVNLQFLGKHFADPKFRERIHGLASATGLQAGELARGTYALESLTSYASPQRRAGMLSEMIKLRKTGDVPLATLAPTFAKMGKIYPGLTGRGQANITKFLLDQAGVSDPAELAAVAPRFFTAGKLGGLDARTAAGMGAFMTLSSGTAPEAATGMRRMLLKIMLKDPDAKTAMAGMARGRGGAAFRRRKAFMGQAGILGGDTGYQRLLKVAALHKRQPLSVQQLKEIFGERGAAQAKVLLEDPEGLQAMVGRFRAETGPGVDIAGGKLATARAADPAFRRIEAGKRLSARITAAEQKPANLLWDNLESAQEAIRKETGGGAWRRYVQWGYRQVAYMQAAVGDDPNLAAVDALRYSGPGEPMTQAQAQSTLETGRGASANIEALTRKLLGVADKLDKVADKLPAANAHTE